MAELHYFSFYAPDWLSSPSILAMLPEQEGAFIRLLATAWGNGDAEPSLPDDNRALASMSRLGAKWKKLGPAIRAQFTERDGKLYNAKLSEVWHKGQKAHALAVTRGKNGAAKRWKDYGRTIDQPLDEPIAGTVDSEWQSDPEGTLVAPTEPTSSPPAKALALEAPRPPEPRLMADNGTTAEPSTIGEVIADFQQRFPRHRRPA